MSLISGISSALSQYQAAWQNKVNQGAQDLSKLGSALQNNDLTDAQEAFSDMLQLLQPGSASTTVSTGQTQSPQTGVSNIQNDLSALGQALQSGDTTSAGTAYAHLQQDLQSAAAPHHHHHHSQASSQAQTNPAIAAYSIAANSFSDAGSSNTGTLSLVA